VKQQVEQRRMGVLAAAEEKAHEGLDDRLAGAGDKAGLVLEDGDARVGEEEEQAVKQNEPCGPPTVRERATAHRGSVYMSRLERPSSVRSVRRPGSGME
jgi:hypothetical protein